MAAVLTPHLQPRTLRPGGTVPRLRLVEGGRSEAAARYRRRRLVAALLAIAVVALTWWGASAAWDRATGDPAGIDVVAGAAAPVASSGAPAAAGAAPVAGPVHVVQPGDTLWSIAADLGTSGDTRALVDELAERTGGAELQVGQRIPLDGLPG